MGGGGEASDWDHQSRKLAGALDVLVARKAAIGSGDQNEDLCDDFRVELGTRASPQLLFGLGAIHRRSVRTRDPADEKLSCVMVSLLA